MIRSEPIGGPSEAAAANACRSSARGGMVLRWGAVGWAVDAFGVMIVGCLDLFEYARSLDMAGGDVRKWLGLLDSVITSGWWLWGWSSLEGDPGEAFELAQELEFASATGTGEGFVLGRIDDGLASVSEQQSHPGLDFARRTTRKAVVTNAREPLGQDVLQPAPDELVGMKVEDGGLFCLAGGPAQHYATLSVVAKEPFGMKGTAPHIARQIAHRRFSAADGLELHVPGLGRGKSANLYRC